MAVQKTYRVQKLQHEEAAGIFAHTTHHLTHFEQQRTTYVLDDEEHEVGNRSSRGFLDKPFGAVVDALDNARVRDVRENCDFVLNCLH